MVKHLTVFLIVVVVFIGCNSLYGQFSGGSGTEADPYQIATAADLTTLGQNTEDYDKHFIMTADIDLAGKGDYPDGSFSHPLIADDSIFYGVFDGAGHAIKQLKISANDDIGLFHYLGPGSLVLNLKLMDGSVVGRDYVGVLCAQNYGTIDHVHCTDIKVDGLNFIGGLCGVNQGLITHSSVDGTVGGTDTVAGICGYNTGVMADCFTNVTIQGYDLVGGFCGVNANTLINCYSIGSTRGFLATGGLCGANSRVLKKCYAAGSTTATSTEVGGLCGLNMGTISDAYFHVDGGPDNGFGVALTDDRMQDQSSFAGFDFSGNINDGSEELWHMPWQSTGYPMLWWQRDIPGDTAGSYGVDMEDYATVSAEWLDAFGIEDLMEVVAYWLEE